MNELSAGTVRRLNRRDGHRSAMAILIAALALGTGLACASGPDPESSGIPGFEPTVKTVPIGPNDRIFVIDSSDVVVASRDRSLLGGIFLLLDDGQLAYRRYSQKLPPRTAVGLLIQPADSLPIDSILRASRAPVVVYEHVTIPRDNQGNPLPIARFLVSSVRNKVARAWIVATDTAAIPRPIPDWILAGATQLVTGFPSSTARNAQLRSQLADLFPLDSLTRTSIPESAIPAGVAGDGAMGGTTQGRVDSRGRPVTSAPPRRLPPQAVAALQSASVIEFMWAREGRGIVKQLIDRTRRGEPLSAILAQAVSLPRDVAALDSAWKASLTPPKPPAKK